MDTTDGAISFDQNGVCNHCRYYDHTIKSIWDPSSAGAKKLERIISNIKKKNRDKQYDCILGLSGGVDSSYLALVLKKYGLRVLAVHVDGGWNSELAVSNIQTIIEHCGFDLHTHVVDWETMRALQLAYFKSGVSNLDVPQDHVFFAVLHSEALVHGCRVFMSGGNAATELTFPPNWHGDAMDRINLLDIFKNHGTGSLVNYKMISWVDFHVLFRLRGFVQVRPLNYLPYNLGDAITELHAIGWRSYPRKHGESTFTKFFQNYFLPERFGYDKRRPHLSSRIHSGEITRKQATDLLSMPLYDSAELLRDKAYIAKKLAVSVETLDSFLHLPRKEYNYYRNWDGKIRLLKLAYKPIKSFHKLIQALKR
jgi:N-acetyl sugar amidotransferase